MGSNHSRTALPVYQGGVLSVTPTQFVKIARKKTKANLDNITTLKIYECSGTGTGYKIRSRHVRAILRRIPLLNAIHLSSPSILSSGDFVKFFNALVTLNMAHRIETLNVNKCSMDIGHILATFPQLRHLRYVFDGQQTTEPRLSHSVLESLHLDHVGAGSRLKMGIDMPSLKSFQLSANIELFPLRCPMLEHYQENWGDNNPVPEVSNNMIQVFRDSHVMLNYVQAYCPTQERINKWVQYLIENNSVCPLLEQFVWLSKNERNVVVGREIDFAERAYRLRKRM